MEKIREELSILEDCIANLENQIQLINLLINNGFSNCEANLIEMKLEYKRNQALLFTISEKLYQTQDLLKSSVYSIYDHVKEMNI